MYQSKDKHRQALRGQGRAGAIDGISLIYNRSHFAYLTFETTGAVTITAMARAWSLYGVQFRAYFIAKRG